VQFLPAVEFRGRGSEDSLRARIATDLFEYSEEQDNGEQQKMFGLLEAIVKGTVVFYEGYESRTRAVRDIVSDDGGKLKVKSNTITESKLYSEIVPIEEFYPQTVWVDHIHEMTYCFRRKIVTYQKFLEDFAQYSQASNVSPRISGGATGDAELPYYHTNISDDVEDGNVEVIYYFNKDTDEYILIANDVWLNPKIIADEEEVTSPIPFSHKELPFWELQFEKFGAGFFYGKSLPDKLKSLQDVFNILSNMLLDQSFLTIFPPILTSGFDSIEDDYLTPGRRISVDTQGLSLSESYRTLDMGTPGGWHQFILSFTKSIMEESSVDQVQSGVAGVGERTTASEIRTAAEGVAATLGIFGKMARVGVKRQAMLRTKNILQYWTRPGNPVISGVLGDGGKAQFAKAFNTFSIDDTRLSNGDRGKKVIMMFAENKQMPTKGELQGAEKAFEILNNENIEFVATPAEYIRNFDFDVKLIANPKLENTQESEKALVLEKARVYLSFFPDLVDKKELAAQVAEKFGDDPTKIFTKQTIESVIADGADKSELATPESTMPTGNEANNMTRGMTTGAGGGASAGQNPFLA